MIDLIGLYYLRSVNFGDYFNPLCTTSITERTTVGVAVEDFEQLSRELTMFLVSFRDASWEEKKSLVERV